MGIFRKKLEQTTFELSFEVRPDIRESILSAPPKASPAMRRSGLKQHLAALNERLSPSEQISTIVYYIRVIGEGERGGYLALGSSTIYVVSQFGANSQPQVLAIPFSNAIDFTFDSGMAFLYFGNPERRIDFGFPYDTSEPTYREGVCRKVRAATRKTDPYAL